MESKSRFTLTDFSAAAVTQWTPDHAQYASGFRCNRPEFASHLRKRVPRDFESHLGQCWIILDSDKIAGYITLLADRLTVLGQDREPKQILRDENVEYSTFPAVKIGLLAADKRAWGVGKRLLYWAIDYSATLLAPKLGVRFLTVDAAYDTDCNPHYDISPYYASFGFEYAIKEESLPPSRPYRTMFVDLKPFIDAQRKLG